MFFSYSSIEHSGLGRYGDTIDPDGDIKTLKKITPFMTHEAKFLIAIPLGQDSILFNRHRVYGLRRLKMIADAINKKKISIVEIPLNDEERNVCGFESLNFKTLSKIPLGSDGIQRLLIFEN